MTSSSPGCSVPAVAHNRLLYRIDDEAMRVYVLHIDHRADVYRPG